MTDNSTPITKRRKPSDAASLSALMPGLGHIYCGSVKRGFLWMGISIGLMIAALVCLLTWNSVAGFTLAMKFLGIDIVVWVCCCIQSWRMAEQLGDDYQLRDYNHGLVYSVLILIGVIGSALGFAFILRERVVQAFVIPSQSMQPTIAPGNRVLTLKEVFLDRDPERGELVVFRNPEQRRQFWIKRVIAIAGDTVEWRENGDVLVNDQPLKRTSTEIPDEMMEEQGDRRYTIKLDPNGQAAFAGQLKVPPYHCFVMGDNRFYSKDSRTFGTIAYAGLEAAPVAKVWGGFHRLR